MPFSGELLAIVVIGGMHSILGPAIGALFFIALRELFPIWSSNWLHWFVLAVVTASYLVLRRITQSPFGMVLQSIRENEERTRAIGYIFIAMVIFLPQGILGFARRWLNR